MLLGKSGKFQGASMSASPSPSDRATESYDVIVVGAGFAGMYMLYRLRGQGFTARVYEQGDGVGGTWYWNRYPGARCDVESMQYSYSFSDELQQEWDWSERYAPQPEILKYANHVADRFNLRPDIQFSTRVERAVFDERANSWSITLSDGKTVTARFVVLATGCLSNARMPEIKGLDSFKGKVYHTGHWPHETVDFAGQRVGVIGTGSSGIQSVPVIAEQASHLTVFQRTANFTIPARNATLTEEERQRRAAFAAREAELAEERRKEAEKQAEARMQSERARRLRQLVETHRIREAGEVAFHYVRRNGKVGRLDVSAQTQQRLEQGAAAVVDDLGSPDCAVVPAEAAKRIYEVDPQAIRFWYGPSKPIGFSD